MHTSASDGTWSPEALIQNVIDAGIEVFSVTDHETVENVAAVSDLAIGTNLTFIRGVEINAYSEGQIFHILGYNIDTENERLNNVLLKNRGFFERQNKDSMAILMKMGHPVSPDEYCKYKNHPERGGWKALNYAIDKGLCQTYKEFFNLFDGKNDFFKMNVDVKPEEAISCVKQAGGIPVLAHPGWQKNHWLVVTHEDDQPLSIRQRGPLRIVERDYGNKDPDNLRNFTDWIWMLQRIEAL